MMEKREEETALFRKYRNLKISRKMTAAFLVICFAAVSLSSIIISYAVMRNSNRRTEILAREINAQVTLGMENFISSCKGLMLAVLVDSETLSFLARGGASMAEQAESQTQINRLLFRLIKMQPALVHASILLDSGLSFQTGVTGETVDLAALAEKSWMRRVREDSETFSVVPMHAAEYTNRPGHGAVISAVQKLYGPSRQAVGAVILDLEKDSFVNLGDESLLQENLQGIRVAIESRDHRLIYDSALAEPETWGEDGMIRFELPDRQCYLIQSQELADIGITVHTIYPKATLFLQRRDLILVTALSVHACVLLSLLCAHLFSRSFTRPIDRLREAILRAEGGEYLPVKGSFNRDEFGDLIRQYNRMAERIEYLISQVYQKDLQKKDAQLIALQTQINPHMMFNTLETIRMKAVIAGNREVAEMTNLLGKMLRMTLENVNEHHTVRNELDYVRSFLRLQNLRFRAENTLEAEVPEELFSVPCPVILFQPLVENCLSHGSRGPDEPLHIRILGERIPGTGLIRFQVTDDGAGMDPDRLMQMADRLEQIRQGKFSMESATQDGRQHIGLENIAKRLHLQYGPEAYLEIVYSNEGGTEIAFRFPDQNGETKEEEEKAWTSGS